MLDSILQTSQLNPLTHPVERHVLVVDDDPFLKPVMRRVLRLIDPSIVLHWADDLKTGIREMERNRFDMFIVDCLLPNGDSGLTLWRLCRESCPEVPFLMISGLSEEAFHRRLGNANDPPHFLAKPFFTEDCSNRIRELLL